jgi:hypothetical protein
MEIWILIGIFLAFGFIGCTILEIYDNIQMNRWMRQRHLRELKLAMRQLEHPEFFSRTHDVSADEIKRAMHAYKTSKVTTTLPTGEVEVLGPGTIIFGEEKADELIQEARDRTID